MPSVAVFTNLMFASMFNFGYKRQLLHRMEKLDIKPDKLFITKMERFIMIAKDKEVSDRFKNTM